MYITTNSNSSRSDGRDVAMEPMLEGKVTTKVAATTRDGALIEQWARLEVVGATGVINGISKLGSRRLCKWVFFWFLVLVQHLLEQKKQTCTYIFLALKYC